MRQFDNSIFPAADRDMDGRRGRQMDDGWDREVSSGMEGGMTRMAPPMRPAEMTGMARMPRRLGEPGMEEMPGRMEAPMPRQSGGGQGMARDLESIQNAPVLDMRNPLPPSVIESPASVAQAQLGSLKAMLSRNVGNYIVATFLVGTQSTVSWEGILYDVGNDYLTIYQEGRDRYVVTDIYSLKFIEFYDFERRRLCDAILGEGGWESREF